MKNRLSDLSKPITDHFGLADHSHEHMENVRNQLVPRGNETRKRKEQRLIFKLGTLAPHRANGHFGTFSVGQLDAANSNQWHYLTFRSA